MSGPYDVYQQVLQAGDIAQDPAQEMAIGYLQSLFNEYQQITESGYESPGGWLPWLTAGRRSSVISPPKGLYFWGGVGRGKTWMMDLFYDTLPEGGKTRLHFHRFMRLVHQQLKSLQGVSDPLREIAKGFSNKSRLLCFDEFYVNDITDAMIFSGLLKALFDEGVILVATSNYHPDQLYENGLQRSKFLPAIGLIKANTHIVNVDGDTDYRLRALESAEIYHFPLDSGADIGLERYFKAISPNQGEAGVVLEIEGRHIRSRYCGDGVVWFDFYELCDGPRSQDDYIEIARMYQTVLVSHVPQMSARLDNQARRFISLVDEFYDRSVKLILAAEVSVDQLYSGTRLSFEFGRTASRLREMMSHEYLAREHKP